MRIAVLTTVFGAAVAVAAPAFAADNSVFANDGALLVAHEEQADEEQHRHDKDEALTREEIREKKRELRRQERELREHEREERVERVRRKPVLPRFWVGAGVGGGWATVDVPCSGTTSDRDCTEEGQLATYSANVTLAGPYSALRVRGVRQQDKGRDARTPYEEAVLIGSRFGRSDWYGFVGAGRIQHPDDEFEGDTHGFAWEVVFAPASYTALGFELSFMGEAGEDVDFFAANVGARFGALR